MEYEITWWYEWLVHHMCKYPVLMARYKLDSGLWTADYELNLDSVKE